LTNTREKQFKGGIIYCGSWFQSFSPWSAWWGRTSRWNEHVIKQNHSLHGGQEAEQETRNGTGTSYSNHNKSYPLILTKMSLYLIIQFTFYRWGTKLHITNMWKSRYSCAWFMTPYRLLFLWNMHTLMKFWNRRKCSLFYFWWDGIIITPFSRDLDTIAVLVNHYFLNLSDKFINICTILKFKCLLRFKWGDWY
jgi:hypothetical protein